MQSSIYDKLVFTITLSNFDFYQMAIKCSHVPLEYRMMGTIFIAGSFIGYF